MKVMPVARNLGTTYCARQDSPSFSAGLKVYTNTRNAITLDSRHKFDMVMHDLRVELANKFPIFHFLTVEPIPIKTNGLGNASAYKENALKLSIGKGECEFYFNPQDEKKSIVDNFVNTFRYIRAKSGINPTPADPIDGHF